MDMFLILFALIWLVIASISDLKKREVANWLNFSLIVFAMAYRIFYSLLYNDIWFFVSGLVGLGIFVCLAYMFYYARVFAGGDAKLLMGLGAILPLGFALPDFLVLAIFIFLLLFISGIYGLFYSAFLALKNKKKFKKEFKNQFFINKNIFYISLAFALLSVFFIYFDIIFIAFPFLFLLFGLLYVYGKAVEESCMIVSVNCKNVTIGDWLYEKVRVNGKTIKPYWEGLSEEEVKLLRKYKRKVKIKQGIPLVPAFLIGFLGWIWVGKMWM